MTTEATTVNIIVISSTDAIYDWGDGSSETVVNWIIASHIYIDGITAHDIIITADGVTALSCGSNSLTALNISNNILLAQLFCQSNSLTILDVSANTLLSLLRCYSNSLTTLDVSNNVLLTQLSCYYNNLTTLGVSNNASLSRLDCQFNNLTTLDLSNNTTLTYLNCYSNNLTNLDITYNTLLSFLSCYRNNLDSTDINSHLNLLVANRLSNGFYIADAQDPIAPPTGQGITDKTTLIADGWTVTTD